MKVSVLGVGRWGSFIAWYLDKIGHAVTLYGRECSENMQSLLENRSSGQVEFRDSVCLTTSLLAACDAQIVVISVGSQNLRGLMQELAAFELRDKIFVLCMKGLEIGSGKRLSEVVAEFVHPTNLTAVWLGPGHVQEFTGGVPNCMVIDSCDKAAKTLLVDGFSSELIRFYYGQDMIGNEIGAAAKNVIGIAAGMLDGMGLSTLKGALMSRGTREVARLIIAMGGDGNSAYGLCHLGDYEATVFSRYSHNRMYGEKLVRGESFSALAEGYYTVKALMVLEERFGVELPICRAVYRVLYEDVAPRKGIDALFARSVKPEFYQ